MKRNKIRGSEKSALDTALSILSRRQITVFKLRQKLLDKGFSAQDVEETTRKLISWKYLDDVSYAQAYLKSKKDKLSKKKLLYGLIQAGLEKELSWSLLEEIYPTEQETENCLQIARKFWDEEEHKWERKLERNPEKSVLPKELFLKKKVGDKLITRGYPISAVKMVLRQVSQREDF